MNLGYATLVLIVYVLAVMRLVRLINGDTILDRLRLWPAGKGRAAREAMLQESAMGHTESAERWRESMGRWNKVLYFIECPWCVGMWMSFGTAWAALFFHENVIVRYVGVALATSHLIGVCARFADTEEITIEDDDDE
ncbi:membrane protein [Mycobacterium phage Quesadilla]|uniref:Membrane protein n=1 Tax=Mycobacterium phage Quesadilla TaxID=2664226 RepID=A0A5Q2WD04_9CAUD|nr:membrane protein [Mycobacterium phage Quesadilla]QGH75258.1 membrane protein [Mycobacterium phage Quesadilla]